MARLSLKEFGREQAGCRHPASNEEGQHLGMLALSRCPAAPDKSCIRYHLIDLAQPEIEIAVLIHFNDWAKAPG